MAGCCEPIPFHARFAPGRDALPRAGTLSKKYTL
jgi:hypothetical protein